MSKIGFYLILWGMLLVGGCTVSMGNPLPDPPAAEAIAILPTQAALIPTLTPAPLQPTFTPIPTASVTPDLPPTNTPLPPAAPFPTPLPVDRTCPNPSPDKPAYRRFVLGGERWPQPQPVGQDRLWLAKPLPGGGRYLFNTDYPYGFDATGAYLLHNGVDSAAPLGTPLLAIGNGTIVVAQADTAELYGWRCDWYGQLVVLELDQTWQGKPIFALYGHVLNINVAPGDRVARGDQVAEVGFGGAATVPHLHFELRVGGNGFGDTRNPMLWIQPPETRGVVAGRLVDPEGRPWQGVWLKAVSRRDGATEYITWTYLDDPTHMINPDELLAENFVIADMLPGEYRVYVQIQEINYQADVTVVGGEISTVEIVTEPYRPPPPSEEEAGNG